MTPPPPPSRTKVSKESSDIVKEKLSQLRQIIPECFSENILDIEKLRKTLGETLDSDDEKYTFSWAGRDDTFKNMQTTSKGTLIPDKSESVNFDDTENIFIEGENLEVLKLLQKSYFGKIKMIYIDPPYNTGNDFIYKDNFNIDGKSYREQTGQEKDGIKLTSNLNSSGRFHSDWISFMYARLYLARNLLREDGIIFVSIDDNEVHNLRLILDEIFGEENFIADIVWNSTKSITNTALISVGHTHNIVYTNTKDFFIKNRDQFRLPETKEGFSNLDNDPRGPWKADPFQVGGIRPNQLYEIKNPKTGKIYKPNPGNSWKNELKIFNELIKDNRIIFGRSGEAGPQRKRFLSEAIERKKVTNTLWTKEPTITNATMKLRELLKGNYFNNPKPVELIERFIQLGAPHKNNIILDFFAGSGTTAHAVMQLNKEDRGNRKFICVQIPEKNETANNKEFPTIAEICKERIRRVIKKLKDNSTKDLDLGFKVFKLAKSNYKIWENYEGKDATKLKEQMKLFENPLITEHRDIDVIYECIIKEGLDLNSRIEKIMTKPNTVYRITEEKTIHICLDKAIHKTTVENLGLSENNTFICIDAALNDSQKTNIAMTCRLKTV